MASYVIAGPAGDEALSECEYLGRQLELSCNASVSVVVKHPDEWAAYLATVVSTQTCSSFGFSRRVTPLVFTTDGKYIGSLEHFKAHVTCTQLRKNYGLSSDLQKQTRADRAKADFEEAEEVRRKIAEGPTLLERIQRKVAEVRADGLIQIVDGVFQHLMQDGLEVKATQFYVKKSLLLAPSVDESAVKVAGRDLPFLRAPELVSVLSSDLEQLDIHVEVHADGDPNTVLVTQSGAHDSSSKSDLSPSPDLSMVSSASKTQMELPQDQEEAQDNTPEEVVKEKIKTEEDIWAEFEVSELNLKDFIEKFQSKAKIRGSLQAATAVPTPRGLKTIRLPSAYVIEALVNGYVLAVHPFPLIPGQLFIFTGDFTDEEGNWLVRDVSMMNNWIRLVSIPSQRPVHLPDQLSEPNPPYESVSVSGFSASVLANRGYTNHYIPLPIHSGRNLPVQVNDLRTTITHILTGQDWEVWAGLVRATGAVGLYQWVPYGAQHYHPLTAGCMSLVIPPVEELGGPIPLLRLVEVVQPQEDAFRLEQLEFEHTFRKIPSGATGDDILQLYVDGMKELDLLHRDLSTVYSDAGITILITSFWLFLAPLYKPIGHEENFDVFLDPLSYLGILHLPVLQKTWPQTASSSTARDDPSRLLSLASISEANFIPK